jgi:exodeoxyribonuclease III
VKIATFNVNGIAARLPRLLHWLDEAGPDIVCLQEIKCEADRFPRSEIEQLGYQIVLSGQKSFNGVAILSRLPLNDVSIGLPGDDSDEQARWIEADVGDVRILCLYLPNGNPQPGPKFDYKLAWMDRMIARAEALLASERPVVMAGDYNVCPTDVDVFSLAAMQDDALVQPESRARFRRLMAMGWLDALRAAHPDGPVYSYWDYRAGAWAKDQGLRIDHILLSPVAADRLENAGVDRRPRGMEQPSDHTPVWISLSGVV